MATAKDIDLTDELDLRVENGDFKIAESDQNHIINLCKAYLGGYKQFPLVGVGIDLYIASGGTQQILKRSISVQLESDGFKVNEIKVLEEDNYYIDANRIEKV
jgi:hypothetical protein